MNHRKQDAVAVFEAGLRAAEPDRAVKRHLHLVGDTLSVGGRDYLISRYSSVYAAGAGKAAAPMARAVEDMLGEKVTGGILNVKYGHDLHLRNIEVQQAGHPLPDQRGLEGALRIVSLLQPLGEDALVIFLVSGGGSALLPCPVTGISLNDLGAVTEVLLKVGADIHEMNILRKHISRLKGGRLAETAFPATVVSLILSDVVGDDLSTIASGPTVPDPSTFGDCLKVIDKYGIKNQIPSSVLTYVEEGFQGIHRDTPTGDSPVFRKVQNIIVGNNTLALEAAKAKAQSLGYQVWMFDSCQTGDTRAAAEKHVRAAKKIIRGEGPVRRPACILSGGETTVQVKGTGLGGRNQEFVLAAALGIDGLESVAVLSCGTDGTDGPTDAAGAFADEGTIRRAGRKNMEAETFLSDNNSYPFFEQLGDLIRTGPTLTNVMDIRILLVT
jgi:hydroxypyruvate reductase